MRVGQKYKAINSAGGNITVGKEYTIKRIEERQSTIKKEHVYTTVIVDLNRLKNYDFNLKGFEYFFGPDKKDLMLSSNIKIL